MTSNYFLADVNTALTLARFHQENLARSVPRKPRHLWPTRPVAAGRRGSVTAVPALPVLSEPVPEPAHEPVSVPGPRQDSGNLLAS